MLRNFPLTLLSTRAFLPQMLTLMLQYFIFWKHGMKETKV